MERFVTGNQPRRRAFSNGATFIFLGSIGQKRPDCPGGIVIMQYITTLFALLFALSANAATLKIEVQGSYDTVTIQKTTVLPDYTLIDAVYDVFSPDLDGAWFNEWSRAHTGTAFLENNDYSSCSGLLTPLCSGRPILFPTRRGNEVYSYAAYDYWLWTGVGETAIYYEDDSEYGFMFEGQRTYSHGGAVMSGTIDRYTVTTVPLPASGLLLASLMLVFLRRR